MFFQRQCIFEEVECPKSVHFSVANPLTGRDIKTYINYLKELYRGLDYRNCDYAMEYTSAAPDILGELKDGRWTNFYHLVSFN